MHLFRRLCEILSHEGCIALIKKIIFRVKWSIHLRLEKYIAQNRWEKAAKIAEKLVHRFPQKIEYYQALARCYKKLGKDDLSTEVIQKGLELVISPSDLQEEIKKELGVGTNVRTTYVYMGGEYNLGCYEHVLVNNGDKKIFFTKISTKSSSEREKLFYSLIYKSFPKVREITPIITSFKELSKHNLSLITMEKIEGKKPSQNEKILTEAIRINKIVSSIKYWKIKGHFPLVNFDREFYLLCNKYSNHPICALHSFESIHKKTTNQKVFYLVLKRIQDLNYSQKSYILMKQLESIILDRELFNKIDPELHYTLQHGDFYINNMLLNEKSGKLHIIDWGNMRIGPPGLDLAGLFGQLKQPFNVVNEKYLLNPDVSLEPIEKLFFIYALIIVWFIVFTQREFDGQCDSCLRPAVEEIESLTRGIIMGEEPAIIKETS